MYQVSSDIVKRVTAYTHEQAAYNLTDYMEEMYLYDISDKLAFNLYRHSYIQTLLDIVDGTDENWAVSCKGPAIPLAGLLSGLKRRGYRHDILSHRPFELMIRVQSGIMIATALGIIKKRLAGIEYQIADSYVIDDDICIWLNMGPATINVSGALEDFAKQLEESISVIGFMATHDFEGND